MQEKEDPFMTEAKSYTMDNGSTIPVKDLVIAFKGAGEMATGIACRLFQANIKNIFMMETAHPLAVRRKVSFSETIFDDTITVEGVTATKAADQYRIPFIWQDNEIPVLADPTWKAVNAVQPHVVIDAIIAKKNLGTKLSEAPLVIGLGPGFDAGSDVHRVIETNRGHNMGRVIPKGPAETNTGIPGSIEGKSIERVLRAPGAGIFRCDLCIGSLVQKGQVIGHVNDIPIPAQIDGMLRGLIRNHSKVKTGLKIGDIDPRGKKASCNSISEKARALGGAVLEAILSQYNR